MTDLIRPDEDLSWHPQLDDPDGPPTDESAPPAPPQSSWGGLVGLIAFFVAIGVWFGMGVILVILAVVVSIFLHEMGHYLAAKKSGMKVTEFFIGFGPRIWSFHRGETEYGIKPIWVGAYVKIIGMNNLEEVPAADEPRTYRRQSYPKRVVTAFAGPGMNLILAFVLLFGLALSWGLPTDEAWPKVDPSEGSAAALAGLEPGDELISFAGEPVTTFEAFRQSLTNRAGETVDVVYERDGERITTTGTLGLRVAGIAGTEWPEALDVAPATDAWDAGLITGDRVISIDGEPAPADFDAFSEQLVAAAGSSVDLVVERDGAEYETTMALIPETRPLGFFGVARYIPDPEPMAPAAALTQSAEAFREMAWTSMYGLYQFFSPSGLSGFADTVVSTGPNESSSPAVVSGGDATTVETSETGGLPTLPPPAADPAEQEDRVHSILGIVVIGSQLTLVGVVFLMALLNIFLAIFNLIPLLPFDGGHIAVATYERIREGLSRRRLVSAHLVAGRYLADFSKLIPVTYAVVGLIIAVGAGALYLDAIDPPTLEN